jgi:hypothetical protein
MPKAITDVAQTFGHLQDDAVDTKRRLPVIKASAPEQKGESEGEPAERPPWHWIGFGTVGVFAAWLPLSYVAQAVRVRVVAARLGEVRSPEEVAAALGTLSRDEQVRLAILLFVPHAVALAIAAFAGGFLVGRWGGAGVGVREAALSGMFAALIATALAWQGWSWVPAVPIALATLAAAWGGQLGKKKWRSRAA